MDNRKLSTSQTIFVYPFTFRFVLINQVFDRLIENGLWQLEPCSSELERRSLYFLPYIRSFLFPFTHWPEERMQKARETQEMKNGRGLVKLLEKEKCIRLQLDMEKSGFQRGRTRKGGQEASFEIKQVKLLLFPVGIGLLIFDTVLNEECLLEKLLFFNASFRLLLPLYPGDSLPCLKFAKDLSPGVKTTTKEMVNYLLAGFQDAGYGEKGSLASPYDKCLLVYTYAPLKECSQSLDDEQDKKVFYALRVFEKSLSAVFPLFCSPEKDNNREYQRWSNSKYGFSKDGGVVLADGNDSFVDDCTKLPRHFATMYLDLFLLVVYQRVALLEFSRRLSEVNQLLENGKLVDELRRDILNFTNWAWFSQVTNSEQGVDIWKRWRKVMEVEVLYKEVQAQLQELDEYIQARRSTLINFKIALITLLTVPATVIFSFLGANFADFEISYHASTWKYLLSFAYVLIILIVFWPNTFIKKPIKKLAVKFLRR